jgi:hypothetical protein
MEEVFELGRDMHPRLRYILPSRFYVTMCIGGYFRIANDLSQKEPSRLMHLRLHYILPSGF